MKVPPYLKPGEVLEILGPVYSYDRLLSLFERAGVLEKIGGHNEVAESRLRDELPEIYDRVFEHFEARSAPAETG